MRTERLSACIFHIGNSLTDYLQAVGRSNFGSYISNITTTLYRADIEPHNGPIKGLITHTQNKMYIKPKIYSSLRFLYFLFYHGDVENVLLQMANAMLRKARKWTCTLKQREIICF
jgi:hypothetical protein